MLTLGAPWSLPEAGQRAFPHKRAGIRANTGRPRASDHRAFRRWDAVLRSGAAWDDAHLRIRCRARRHRRSTRELLALEGISLSSESSLTSNVSVAPRAAAAAPATSPILRLVDLELPAVEVLAIQSLHRARGVGIGHLDEAEATGTTGVAIGDEREPLDGSMRCEQGTQGVFRRAEGEISDVELGHFRVPTE